MTSASTRRRVLLLRLFSSLCLSASFCTTDAWIGPSYSGAIRLRTVILSAKLTENGGYAHTEAAKAKISAAKKGKPTWNKGIKHSPEVRAKIGESLRRSHRQAFLKKLQDNGLTEEEFHAQKAAEAKAKEARRTENGGYRLSEETKAKISNQLKGRKKPRGGGGGRRKGHPHSEETRRKISETLRLRWAEDPKMLERKQPSLEMKQKISATLKKKWEDPEFKQRMLLARKQKRKVKEP